MNRKWIKRGVWIVALLFALMNGVAFFHAYTFTHFARHTATRTKSAKDLTVGEKIVALTIGVSNPRPENKTVPTHAYQTVTLNSNTEIECWSIAAENPKGTVVLFHGFNSAKSSLLDRADVFHALGYNTFLVDFMGSGGSEGNLTTIGFWEAKQVKTCVDYLTGQGEQNIYLFGVSMGAVALMKAIRDEGVRPRGIIMECPFASMYRTVCVRFEIMRVPTFPMAGLLVFWGGMQHGFWAFAHRPTDYAKSITCPALLFYGVQDERVGRTEIDAIFTNLAGPKTLKVYPTAGHANDLFKHKDEWTRDVQHFFQTSN
ncbi:MAG: lysophospholipase [Kiritimatiellaeota bacterium]|nr:lysophospholipase [Kiritimatiellota bacterium]